MYLYLMEWFTPEEDLDVWKKERKTNVGIHAFNGYACVPRTLALNAIRWHSQVLGTMRISYG